MPSENRLIILITMFISVLLLSLALIPSKTFSGSFAGHLVGIFGTVLMLLTLIYPFRKRIQGKKGRKNSIAPHIYYGLSGPTLVAVHAGHGFVSLIGTLAFLSLVLIVLSGIAGTFLFRRVNRSLKEQKADLESLKRLFHRRRQELDAERCFSAFQLEGAAIGGELTTPEGDEHFDMAVWERCSELFDIARSMSEKQYASQVFSSTKDLFSRWLKLHIYLTVFLFAMIIVHILTTLYYGLRWLP